MNVHVRRTICPFILSLSRFYPTETSFPMMRRRTLPFLLFVLAGLGLLFVPPSLQAQTPSGDEVGPLLRDIVNRTEAALQVSKTAEEAQSVADVKAAADSVFRAVWGISSGIAPTEAKGGVAHHGWKVRWQTTEAAFDSAFAARMGAEAPEINDPKKLGIMGRARHLRSQFAVAPDSADPETPGARYSHDAIVAPLSNVIGWMRMDNGITKGELQPRVDLTYRWDAPMSFWKSTADTGWLFEALAQAQNILKTAYDGDVEMARDHAAGMTQLLKKSLEGVDANGNGTVEAKAQEGGLRAALEQAQAADLARR
ncbi:hypothetical protein BSZ35_00555 [Salinibacter sp. 10B]|nr:hypothetical protein BSZ35_00555 [Salinibacter sp. 10B]